jgi:aliphatic sulfonates family ABC transporter substrate-binding protein
MQVKLLRVLATQEVTRIGARTSARVDVRLIAATNVDLREAIRERRFREDLFYRLNVTSLALPPLRERPGDVLALAAHFLAEYARRYTRSALRLSTDAREALLAHDWPGNVRELENVIRQAVVLCAEDEVRPDDLGLVRRDARDRVELARPDASVSLDRNNGAPAEAEAAAWLALEGALSSLFSLPQRPVDLHSRIEAALLSAAFDHAGGNQLETARLLGLSRHVVRARLLEHGQVQGRARGQRSGSNGLRIGFQRLGVLALVKAHGAFDAALGSRGLKIAWQEYAGGIQIVDALRRGDLDLGVVGDCPAVYAQATGVPVVYVASEPPAPRGVAIVASRHSGLRSISDLRGKRVAVNRAAQAHFLLILALEEAGLSLHDIELRFEAPSKAFRQFESGSIDAWAIWDPWLSSAIIDLEGRVLRDASGLFDSSVYYLARQSFAATFPELVTELRNQLNVAARWIESDPNGAAALVAPTLGFSPRAVAASLNRELANNDRITAGQLLTQQKIADQCLRLRLIHRPVSVAAAQWQSVEGATAPRLREAARRPI